MYKVSLSIYTRKNLISQTPISKVKLLSNY